jgi:type II secretory pathway pseudopilin PulG
MASTASAPTASARPKRSRALIVIVVVIVALAAVLIGGEFYVRNNVKQCMADQFESQLGSQVDVGLSAKPVLLQAIDKKVPHITIDSDDSSFGPAKDMNVHARVNDIDLTSSDTSGGTIGSSSADIDWSSEGIAATIAAQPFGTLVTGVTTDPTAGTIRFAVLGNLAELTVQPTISNGVVNVETIGAELFGLGLPTDLVSGVVDILTSSLQTFPLGMTPQSLTVTDTGLQLSLSGGPFTLPAPEPGAQPVEGCSVLI